MFFTSAPYNGTIKRDKQYTITRQLPNIIHTNGDTFALSYLTYAWNERHEYGPTVKVIDIAASFDAETLRKGVMLRRGKKNFSKLILK